MRTRCVGALIVAAAFLCGCGHSVGAYGVWHTDADAVSWSVNVMRLIPGNRAVYQIVTFGEHGETGPIVFCTEQLVRRADGSWTHARLARAGLELRVESNTPVLVSSEIGRAHV
jgi:hypothetical protein